MLILAVIYIPLKFFNFIGLPVFHSTGWYGLPNNLGYLLVAAFYVVIIYVIIKISRKFRLK